MSLPTDVEQLGNLVHFYLECKSQALLERIVDLVKSRPGLRVEYNKLVFDGQMPPIEPTYARLIL